MNFDDTMEQYLRMMHILGQELPPTQEAGTMGIEVGKIILLDGVASGRYATHREEQAIKVSITTSGVGLYATGGNDGGARELLYGNGSPLTLAPEQALELAQLLMKAAEVQPEYAAEEKRLREEHEQLDKKYTSLLDGSKADDSVVVDVEDARSGFVLNKALG